MKQRINASSAKGKRYPSSQSIVQIGATADNKDEMYCYLSGLHTDLEVHHIFNGPKRKWSDENGLWVYLNHNYHMALHSKRNDWERKLKRDGQKAYEKTHSREEFIKNVGKNYL